MPLNRQIKIRQISFRMYVYMAIPYQTTKFKSNNSVENDVWAQTAKFNDRQYFQLYGIFSAFGTTDPPYHLASLLIQFMLSIFLFLRRLIQAIAYLYA